MIIETRRTVSGTEYGDTKEKRSLLVPNGVYILFCFVRSIFFWYDESINYGKGSVQMKNRVNLRVDFAFKQLFGTKGNEEILMRFLNEVLQKSLASPITIVSLEDPHLHKEYKEDKLSIMDVRATLGTGELVNIEIQLANKHD